MKLRSKILWSTCEAHCIALMLEIVAQGKVMQQVIGRVKKITNILSIILASCIDEIDNHELLLPSITRFTNRFIATECLQA